MLTTLDGLAPALGSSPSFVHSLTHACLVIRPVTCNGRLLWCICASEGERQLREAKPPEPRWQQQQRGRTCAITACD